MKVQLLLLSSLFVLFLACKEKPSQEQVVEETAVEEAPDKLLGVISKSDLEQPQFSDWFSAAYEDYTVNTDLLNNYKEELKEYEIEVFMGTWCEDSQREVPTLFKILEAAEFPSEKLKVVAIDDEIANYKKSPGGEEIGKNIHHVPTIILKKDGEETSRIIEYPVRTLEEDFQQILGGEYRAYYYVADMVHEKLNELGLEAFEGQLDELAVALKGMPTDVYELNTYAKTIFRQGKKEEGIAVATLNTMIYPDKAEAFVGLGQRFSDLEDYENALPYFEKAVELAPDDSEFKGMLEEVQSKL